MRSTRVLHDIPSALVARLSPNGMKRDEKLEDYFSRKFFMSLEDFAMVLTIPLLFDTVKTGSQRFWNVYVKNTMEEALPGLRIVVLAAYRRTRQ